MNTVVAANEKQKRTFPDRKRPQRNGGGLLQDKYELAPTLGESLKTIDTWTKNGVIPFIQCGPHTKRYRLDDVLRALQRRQVKAVN
jgi:hypothetical protein